MKRMIVVHYREDLGGYDCWGGHESNYVARVEEFKTVGEWLAFRKDKDIEFIALYEVSKKITD